MESLVCRSVQSHVFWCAKLHCRHSHEWNLHITSHLRMWLGLTYMIQFLSRLKTCQNTLDMLWMGHKDEVHNKTTTKMCTPLFFLQGCFGSWLLNLNHVHNCHAVTEFEFNEVKYTWQPHKKGTWNLFSHNQVHCNRGITLKPPDAPWRDLGCHYQWMAPPEWHVYTCPTHDHVAIMNMA